MADRYANLDGRQTLRREALAGRVVVERLRTLDEQGERFKVPKGAINHWLGAILVPNATLNDVLDGLQYDIPPHELQEDVIESRVLSRDGDTFELYVKVKLETPLTSAQLNIEQTVEYVRPGGRPGLEPDRGDAHRRARRTRLAERAREADRQRQRLRLADEPVLALRASRRRRAGRM